MKDIFLIGSAVGVGRTAVGQRMKGLPDRCVLLDGDRCCDMRPFSVTEETRRMVLQKI